MTTEVFAVSYEETIHHEGDQRSRDFPGHGYGEYTESKTIFKSFNSQKEFEDWVKVETSRPYGKKFKAYRCTPIEVTTEVKIVIK